MKTDTDALTAQDREIWQAAFMVLLPAAITAQGWLMGDKPISSGESRVNLAAAWADYAVKEARARQVAGDQHDIP